jgi:hypothetical protein
MSRRAHASSWALSPDPDWTEVLDGLPVEGVPVQVWPDGGAPLAARLDRGDWLMSDGRRVPLSMRDSWAPLPAPEAEEAPEPDAFDELVLLEPYQWEREARR